MKTKFYVAAAIIVLIFFYSGVAHANPLKTHDARVIKDRSLELDFNLTYSKLQDKSMPTGDYLVALPHVDLRYGIADRVELLGSFEGLYLRKDDGDHEYDVGDIYLWTKIRLYDKNDHFFHLSGLLGVKIPSADDKKGLGTDEADVYVMISMGHTESHFSFNMNFGIGILGNTHLRDNVIDTAQRDVLAYGFSYEFFTGKVVSVFCELNGCLDFAESEHEAEFRAGMGFRYKRAKFYFVLGKGLTEYSPDWTAQAGVNIKF